MFDEHTLYPDCIEVIFNSNADERSIVNCLQVVFDLRREYYRVLGKKISGESVIKNLADQNKFLMEKNNLLHQELKSTKEANA